MDILYDSTSVLEALYDLVTTQGTVLEEIAVMNHNYKKTGDMDVLTEGVNDIIDLIISSVKKFIQKIKDYVIRKFMILNSYRMEYDKLIEKYRDVLQNAKFDPFSIEGFEFTTLSRPRPNVKKAYDIIEEFNSTIAKFASLTTNDIRAINNEECSDIAIQRLRATILGTSERIAQEEFKKTCFMFYRNDREFASKIDVTEDLVKTILSNSGSLIAERKAVKTDKDMVMSVLNNMERFFSVKVSALYDDIKKTYSVHTLTKNGMSDEDVYTLSERELGKLTMYLSCKYNMVVELANIISVVFAERLSAIDSQTNQELEILREVLKVQKGTLEGFDHIERVLATTNSFPPTPNPNWVQVWEGISDIGRGVIK